MLVGRQFVFFNSDLWKLSSKLAALHQAEHCCILFLYDLCEPLIKFCFFCACLSIKTVKEETTEVKYAASLKNALMTKHFGSWVAALLLVAQKEKQSD